jgi:hypothetical protein
MMVSPSLLVYIAAGTVGLLSGAVAISFLKGSRRHAIAGTVFVVAMLTLGATGVYMAVVKSQAGNVFGGVLTIYLVVTGWATGRRREIKSTALDWGALFVALAIGATGMAWALEAARSPTGMAHGYAPGTFIFLGSIALLSAAGDVRMMLRGGISGTQRIARHLWRMCFALFIASMSVFLARAHIFPVFMQKTGMLYMVTVLPLALMIFWLVRVRLAPQYKRLLAASAGSRGRDTALAAKS